MCKRRGLYLLSLLLVFAHRIYYAPSIKAQQDRVEHNISTGDLVIKDSGTYYVTGTSSSYHIMILKDSEPTVILDNVSIETKGRHHAIKLEDNA